MSVRMRVRRSDFRPARLDLRRIAGTPRATHEPHQITEVGPDALQHVTVRTRQELDAAGAQIVLDDFGTGDAAGGAPGNS
jgi:EAL domain-containing protein (putative c-di-GMP-specific phosphodiesterase class I)